MILWHKHFRNHPIANPTYAKENLVSLAETILILFLYFSAAVLFFHWLVILGFFVRGNIPWGIIEGSAHIIPFKPKFAIYDEPFEIFIAIVTTIVSIKIIKNSFELMKAAMHPKRARAQGSRLHPGKLSKLPPFSTGW